MADVQALINEALRKLGVIPQGDSPNETESDEAFAILNDELVDSLKNDRLMAYGVAPVTKALVIAQQAYTYGSGGDFDETRPSFIAGANIVVSNISHPLDLLNEAQWRAIKQKTMTAPIPERVFDDGGYPLRTLRFHPIPSGAASVELYPWVTLQPFASLATEIDVPPGYWKMLVNNLAVLLGPSFGMEIPQSVTVVAVGSKQQIAKQNELLISGALRPEQIQGGPTRGLPAPEAPAAAGA